MKSHFKNFFNCNFKSNFSLLFLLGFASCSYAQSPKNIILMICDGCGFNQFLMADYYEYGETGKQVFQKFEVQGAVSTWSLTGNKYDPAKAQDASWVLLKPTDSAASATAYATGFKTYDGAIGVDTLGRRLTNLSEVAFSKHKAAGVITTVPFAHATPASFAAHNPSRKNYEQIAYDMLFNSTLQVVIGAGHPLYDNDGLLKKEEVSYEYVGGKTAWEDLQKGRAKNLTGDWSLLSSYDDFKNALDSSFNKSQVFGVLEVESTVREKSSARQKQSFPYQLAENKKMPSLSLLAHVGLKTLSKNENGFFLLIEGGAVDWAGHDNILPSVIEEQVDFNHAVNDVVKWIEQNGGWQENLLVITADHETGYLSGPKGLQGETIDRFPVNQGKDKMPIASWNTNHHTNQLVPLFANGVGANKLLNKKAGEDPRLGVYTDNALIGQTLQELWKN